MNETDGPARGRAEMLAGMANRPAVDSKPRGGYGLWEAIATGPLGAVEGFGRDKAEAVANATAKYWKLA